MRISLGKLKVNLSFARERGWRCNENFAKTMHDGVIVPAFVHEFEILVLGIDRKKKVLEMVMYVDYDE